MVETNRETITMLNKIYIHSVLLLGGLNEISFVMG